MEKPKREVPASIEVTPETLPSLRRDIAIIREQRGSEKEAFAMIRTVREGAIALGEHEDVVNLYWEEYLVGKHLVLSGGEKEGAGIMRDSAVAAQKYIDQHGVESLRPRSHRFLGETDMIQGRYAQAISHFREGIDLFNQMENGEQRVNVLELSGFLAEALILAGKEEQGIEVAHLAFQDYDRGEGAKFRERDYYTWAVWRSGCAIKTWNAFLETGKLPQGEKRSGLDQMLTIAEESLTIPADQTTWGDRNFEIRKAEIAEIRQRAQQL